MKKTVTTIIVIFVIVIAFLVAGPFFVINEGEQAVVVQFGRITNVVTEAGLHLKVPFIDEVIIYPRKILAWDGEARIIPTAERQFIFVDVVARWRISDPRIFYESVGSVAAAHSKLSEIIDSAIRTVVAENNFNESLRNSNSILDRVNVSDIILPDDIEYEIPESSFQAETRPEPIERGRRQLAEEMLRRSAMNADTGMTMQEEFGIELIDVVTRQISYSPELTPSVFARMTRERNQQAAFFRSDGEGRKAAIIGEMEHQRRTLISRAEADAQIIMGLADAEAARIYADAFNRNIPFFNFWRAMESYRTTAPSFDMFLSTDIEYFRFLHIPR
ncbi:MAG: protease modulator HflC [Treponema sp.]|nr:protease modulator HflC [Treponema sp.]